LAQAFADLRNAQDRQKVQADKHRSAEVGVLLSTRNIQ
jgi:hypothetical protein